VPQPVYGILPPFTKARNYDSHFPKEHRQHDGFGIAREVSLPRSILGKPSIMVHPHDKQAAVPHGHTSPACCCESTMILAPAAARGSPDGPSSPHLPRSLGPRFGNIS
jgi:hypothetical protein